MFEKNLKPSYRPNFKNTYGDTERTPSGYVVLRQEDMTRLRQADGKQLYGKK